MYLPHFRLNQAQGSQSYELQASCDRHNSHVIVSLGCFVTVVFFFTGFFFFFCIIIPMLCSGLSSPWWTLSQSYCILNMDILIKKFIFIYHGRIKNGSVETAVLSCSSGPLLSSKNSLCRRPFTATANWTQ